MQMFNKLWSVAVLGVMLTGVINLSSQTRAADEPPPVRIAVVNIVKVFNALDAKKSGDTDFELIGKQLEKERTTREDELGNLKREQQSYNPDSQEFRDTSEKMMKKAMELESFTRYMREKMLLEGRIRTAALYRSMNKAIEDFSKANGIGLVLSMDELDFRDIRSQEELMSKIAVRKVIYAHDSYDITKKIIDKMNSDAKTTLPPTH